MSGTCLQRPFHNLALFVRDLIAWRARSKYGDRLDYAY